MKKIIICIDIKGLNKGSEYGQRNVLRPKVQILAMIIRYDVMPKIILTTQNKIYTPLKGSGHDW